MKKFINNILTFLFLMSLFCCVSTSCSKTTPAVSQESAQESKEESVDKTVPIKVIYDDKTVDNEGGLTDFKVKIPLNDLGVRKPTNIYIEFDFLVNGVREDFIANFDLTW